MSTLTSTLTLKDGRKIKFFEEGAGSIRLFDANRSNVSIIFTYTRYMDVKEQFIYNNYTFVNNAHFGLTKDIFVVKNLLGRANYIRFGFYVYFKNHKETNLTSKTLWFDPDKTFKSRYILNVPSFINTIVIDEMTYKIKEVFNYGPGLTIKWKD